MLSKIDPSSPIDNPEIFDLLNTSLEDTRNSALSRFEAQNTPFEVVSPENRLGFMSVAGGWGGTNCIALVFNSDKLLTSEHCINSGRESSSLEYNFEATVKFNDSQISNIYSIQFQERIVVTEDDLIFNSPRSQNGIVEAGNLDFVAFKIKANNKYKELKVRTEELTLADPLFLHTILPSGELKEISCIYVEDKFYTTADVFAFTCPEISATLKPPRFRSNLALSGSIVLDEDGLLVGLYNSFLPSADNPDIIGLGTRMTSIRAALAN